MNKRTNIIDTVTRLSLVVYDVVRTGITAVYDLTRAFYLVGRTIPKTYRKFRKSHEKSAKSSETEGSARRPYL